MARLTNPIQFYNDEEGRTLKNAKLYFYDSGTFDVKDTYSDAALTSVNPNPVVADGAGRFPNIFMETGSYRLVLEDEDGVEIATKDDVANIIGDGEDISTALNVTTATDTQTVAGALDNRIGKFESLSDAVSAVNAGDVNVGVRVETLSYYGGWTAGVDDPKGGNVYELVDAGSAGARPAEDDGSVIHCTGGSGGLYLKGLFLDERYTIDRFGYGSTQTVTVNTVASQNCIDYVSSIGGGYADFPAETITIESQGLHDGFPYGLMLKDGVTIRGHGREITRIKSDAGQDMTVITDDRTVQSFDLGIVGMTIDGNEPNQTPGEVALFNIWIKNSDRLHLSDVYSKDPGSFGFRLETCTNLTFENLQSDHGAEETADGFHLIDCSYVTGRGVIVNTRGDDGFVIEANGDDTHDIDITGVIVTAPVTTTAAGKGVYIVNSAANGTAGVQRKLYNINVEGETYNCKASACILERGEFYNVNVKIQDYGSFVGLNLIVGDTSGTGVTGYVKQCSFDIASYQPDENAVINSIADGVIEFNYLKLRAYDTGDNFPAVQLRGDSWEAHMLIDYDPDGTKVSPKQGAIIYGNDNEIHLNCDRADTSIRVEGDRNDIHLIRSSNPVTRDIELIAGADNNTFIGGRVTTSVSNSGTGNRFHGTRGADEYGVASSVTPDANGNVSIPHNLVTTPTTAFVSLRGDSVNEAVVQSVSFSNIVVRIRNTTTNADITAGTFDIDWKASL